MSISRDLKVRKVPIKRKSCEKVFENKYLIAVELSSCWVPYESKCDWPINEQECTNKCYIKTVVCQYGFWKLLVNGCSIKLQAAKPIHWCGKNFN